MLHLQQENAAISIWGDDKTDVGMCSFHAFQCWRDCNKSYIRDETNLKLMNAGFEKFKQCPFLELVPFLMKAMITKRKVVYKENIFAEN